MDPVGVLALQGGFAAHAKALASCRCAVREVRSAADLHGLRGLVLPGGESSAQLRLLRRLSLWEPLRELVHSGRPVLATCAGLILLAKTVLEPEQDSLDALDVTVRRNGFGSQVDSFLAQSDDGQRTLLFIRAPRLLATGPGVAVLARLRGEPVLVRQGAITAATYHPELVGDVALHREIFLS